MSAQWDELNRLRIENERLRSQLAAARREAIRECLQISTALRRSTFDRCVSAIEAESAIMKLLDAPTAPALAPLREATTASVPINRYTGRPCDHAYIRRDPTSTAINWICDLCGNKLAALSAASATAEERTDV